MSDSPTEPPQPPEGGPQAEPDSRKRVAKLLFEMGQSLRVIGAQVGVSEKAIRLWAKDGGWVKGSPAKRVEAPAPTAPPKTVEVASNIVAIRPDVKVSAPETQGDPQSATRGAESAPQSADSAEPPLDEVFRARVRQLLENPTRDEAADVAARAVVQVVMENRKGIAKLQRIVDKLAGQLDFASEEVMRGLIEQAIVESTEPGKARNALLELVSLRSHAATARDLSTAMVRMVTLERQAFGLSTNDNPTPEEAPKEAAKVDDDQLTAIRERVRLRLAGGTTA